MPLEQNVTHEVTISDLKGLKLIDISGAAKVDDKWFAESGSVVTLILHRPKENKQGYYMNVRMTGSSGLTVPTTDEIPEGDSTRYAKISFVMPIFDVTFNVEYDNAEVPFMEGKQQSVIDYFEIPEELAKELSELLTKQVIRERLLNNLVREGDMKAYNEAEQMLIPVTARIEAIKVKITKEFVPAKYNSAKYMWNYDGWEVDQNKVQIIEAM